MNKEVLKIAERYPSLIKEAALQLWEKYGADACFAVPWGWEYEELSNCLFLMTTQYLLDMFQSKRKE